MEFLIALLVWAIAILIVGSIAYWIITKFFTGELAAMQTPALAIVGLLLLLWLLSVAMGYLPNPIRFPIRP